MDPFVAALALGAIVTALLVRDKRSVFYIIIGAADFAASYTWGVKGLPYHSVFTAICDGMVCVTIYLIATQRWEMWLYLIFQGSVLISILDFAGYVPGTTAYAIALEVVNWAALLLIGGTALARMIGDGGGAHGPAGHLLRRADSALRAHRTSPSWWHA